MEERRNKRLSDDANGSELPNQSVKKSAAAVGSGCGSVGRAVSSDTRCPRFESSHQQKFIYTLNISLLSTVY